MIKKIKIEEVKKFLESLRKKERAIVLLMLTSGMDIETVMSLKYIDFLRSIDAYIKDMKGTVQFPAEEIRTHIIGKDEIIGTWYIKNNATGFSYITFNTHESTMAILDYIIEKEAEEGLVSFYDQIFQCEDHEFYDSKIFIKTFLMNRSLIIGDLIDAENLRILFKETLLNHGADMYIVKSFLGCREACREKNYSLTEIESLKKIYSTFTEHLTVGINKKQKRESNMLSSKDMAEEWWDYVE